MPTRSKVPLSNCASLCIFFAFYALSYPWALQCRFSLLFLSPTFIDTTLTKMYNYTSSFSSLFGGVMNMNEQRFEVRAHLSKMAPC